MDGEGPRRRRQRTTPVGRTGARFAPVEILADHQPVPPPREPARSERPPLEQLPSESDVLIRPYARTGGRTRPTHDLALEAMITTAPHVQGRYLSREHRAIANLCIRPRSVAEVAALLTLPLGVARVLLGDLATDGAIRVHRTSAQPPDLLLMHRVLAGLRRL